MSRIPIEQIKTQICISDVAAQYGDVQPRGRLRVCRCLCGQNSDRNPSFTLYEDDNHFHCYACQRHGSVIDLIMLVENLDFKAACDWLRERFLGHCDVALPVPCVVQRPPAPQAHQLGADVRRLLEIATEHYCQTLWQSPTALALLHRRGLSDSTIANLRLGYSAGNLAEHLHAQGCSLNLAARIGLLNTRGETMAQRLIFPVLDRNHAPVWLIGRATQDRQQPKYLGLPDGLTRKRPMVIGQAQRGIVLVEGAIDFAALVQWGMLRDWLCVGLLGTAHSAVIERLAQNHSRSQVLILLDQDAAGKDAAFKAALALRKRGLQPTIVVDADRHNQQCAFLNANPRLQQTALASVLREVSLVEQMQAQQLLCWVHWRGEAKDCGDLLAMGEAGECLFAQVVQP